MTNIFASLKDYLQMKLDDEPKNPLHVGKVMSLWKYLALMDEATVYIQIGLNTTTDDIVHKMLTESLKQCDEQASNSVIS